MNSKPVDNINIYIYQFNTNFYSFILFNKYLSGYYMPSITEINKGYI